MDLQKLVDSMNETSRLTRAQYQLTLGGLIERLENVDGAASVSFGNGIAPGNPESYRGYYSDLAFEPSSDPVSAADLLAICRGALGQTFEGYKGGDFVMSDDTPLWLSDYGIASGIAIMDVIDNGDSVLLATKQID